MKLVLLSLFLSSCTLPFAVDHLSVPDGKTVRVRRGDTLRTTPQELVRAAKIKNRGTIIVQAGESNNASVVGKAKAPVAVGAQAKASQEVKKTSFWNKVKYYAAGTVILLLVMSLAFRRLTG